MPAPSLMNYGARAFNAGGLVHKRYQHNGFPVINSSGSSIAAAKLVVILGFDTTSKRPKIVLADADAASTHKDVYMTFAAVATGSETIVWKGGLSDANLDTSGATSVGDPVYLSTTAGAFTHTAPSASNSVVIPVGWVVAKSSTVGQIFWHIGKVEKMGSNEIQSGVGVSGLAPVDVTGSSVTLDAATHGNRTVTLSRAAGVAVTLPAATGTGNKYKLIYATALTSASSVISPNGSDTLFGGVFINDTGASAAATVDFYPTAAGNNTTTLAFSAGAGKKGDTLTFEDFATNCWQISGVITGELDPTNPFSTV